MRFPWQRHSQETLLPRVSLEGGRVGGSDNLYRTCSLPPNGRSRINIRWLISFRPDQGVAFLKFSRQIVPSRGNRPFSPSTPLAFTPPSLALDVSPDPTCPSRRIISASRGDIHLPPRSSSILVKAAIVDGIIGRNIPGIGGARDMSLEMKRSVDRSYVDPASKYHSIG